MRKVLRVSKCPASLKRNDEELLVTKFSDLKVGPTNPKWEHIGRMEVPEGTHHYMHAYPGGDKGYSYTTQVVDVYCNGYYVKWRIYGKVTFTGHYYSKDNLIGTLESFDVQRYAYELDHALSECCISKSESVFANFREDD